MEVKVEDIIKNVKEWVRNIQKQYSGILQLGGITEKDKVRLSEAITILNDIFTKNNQ